MPTLAPPEEVEAVRVKVKSEMESVRKFEVPLLVDSGKTGFGACEKLPGYAHEKLTT